jgi:NAD(P)-dependent dehydrogenase (short-subunit alcohol dehydrogenase family)
MGLPDDISPAISFLLSDESKYITGQNLIIDGGWTAI